MPVVYEDILLTVETGEAIPFGTSLSQHLDDGIIFTIRSPFARMIQFKCRRLIWAEGPNEGQEDSDGDFNNTDERLDYQVDALNKPDPYYDSGGACRREGGKTMIADQPDVDFQRSLLWEQDKDWKEMKTYGVINQFRALSFIISNNKVIRMVQWCRTGSNGKSEYHDIAVTKMIPTIPPQFVNIMRDTGYNPPILLGQAV